MVSKNNSSDVEAIARHVRRLEKKIDTLPTKVVQELDKNLEAYVENRKTDLLGVSAADINLLQQKVASHEERLVAVEQR